LPAFCDLTLFSEVFTLPDWTAPFHMPEFTDKGYTYQKAKYVAKEGYTVTVPGLSDIIHWGVPKPMTEREARDWRNKDWKAFSSERREELTQMKKKKKERYQAMLASPTPEFVTNAGSILTSLDDAQDAISSLAFVGRIAAKLAPRLLAKFFTGPVGWLLMANDILNLIIAIGQYPFMPMQSKRLAEQCTSSNPFSKKAKVKRSKKVRSWKPTKGDVIQLLQTTDQVFGYGISLGPIVGLFQDVVAGTVRTIMGDPVKVKWPWGSPPLWAMPAFRSLKSISNVLAVPNIVDDDIMQELLLANYLANQAIQPYAQQWNPLDQVEDLDNTRILCPVPSHPLTLEVIEEEGIPISQVVGWPHSGKPWASPGTISDATASVARDNMAECVARNKNNWNGYAFGLLAAEASTYQLSNLEGEEAVSYDYHAKSKIMLNLLGAGLSVNPNNSKEKLKEFRAFMLRSERLRLPTGITAINSFCADQNISLLSFGGS